MNGQAERCDRTAYVSGLQPTISDIELFEIFNRVAHVEKVIVRSGATRHALVVFKSVEGLYQVLLHFQGTTLHGRQLHIRPLRESSHAISGTISSMFEQAKNQQGYSRRPASVQERFTPTPTPTDENRIHSARSYRNSSDSYNRRRSGYNKNQFQNETYSGTRASNNYSAPTFPGFNAETFQFDNYAEGAKRFDNLANVIRANTPSDPFANYQSDRKSSDPNTCIHKSESRSRTGSVRDQSVTKQAPPTWKMELQIKKSDEEEMWKHSKPAAAAPITANTSMTAQQFLNQIAQSEQSVASDQSLRKKRPNLSVINPSLFYEQYPRTSSPVTFAPSAQNYDGKITSPHDPAIVSYGRMKAPQSAFDGLSPIDTNNCSFITKHLGTVTDNNASQLSQIRRDFTNEELSDMIVSTGNLRINPTVALNPVYETSICDEPAPWSPLKRLRAESGCQPSAQFASPQFSPIKLKSIEFNDIEDDVFSSENRRPDDSVAEVPKSQQMNGNSNNVLMEPKMQNYEDINNSRLPSNSHSANPRSDKKAFVFPDYPLCRHSSVPSIAHLVGDLSDFCTLSPHVTAGANDKHFMEKSDLNQSPSDVSKEKSYTEDKEQLPNKLGSILGI